jgi:phospholipid-binding lipoprotein MlaA
LKHVKQILLLIIIIALLNSPLPAYSPDGSDKVPASDLSLVVAEAEAEEMAAQKRVETADEFGDDSNGDFDDEFEDEYGDIDEFKVYDPLRGYNRFIVNVNDKLYFWILKPAALGLQYVIPKWGRVGINRFFNNLLSPVHVTNNLLQLKFRNAGEVTLRFVINTTVGILGFWDPAMDWFELEPHFEDFGQTLGHYGVGSGFHIVLPLWGHSNLRDIVGLAPDFYLNPLTYTDDKVEWGSWLFWTVNDFSLEIGEYETIKNDALDLYPFMRDTYEQKRDKEIRE